MSIHYDYQSGIRGLKQIARAMEINKIGNLEKYTEMFLDRFGYIDWYNK